MILPPFTYLEPRSLDEACALLARHEGNARVLAGGTDILVDLKQRIYSDTQRMQPVEYLVSLCRIPGLNGITIRGDSIVILQAPPGPHDGFLTWYTVTYEERNRADNNFQDLFVPEGSVSAVSTSIAKLNEDFVQAQARRIPIEAALKQAGEMQKAGEELDSLPQVASDPVVNGFNTQIAGLSVELGKLGEKFKEGHPEVQKVKAQLEQLKKARQARARQILDGLEAEYAQLRKRESELRSAIDTQKALAANESRKVTELDTLKKEADSAKSLYEVLLQMLARYFAHTDETEAQLAVLADVAVGMMYGAVKPLGSLVTRLPVGLEYPELAAGPAFELFYAVDYLLPHRQAAWVLMEERLREVADLAMRCRDACIPTFLVPLSKVTDALRASADRLGAARLPAS